MNKMDHIGNLLAAKAMIEAMPNEAFSVGLVCWANVEMQVHGPTCGAVGCFGGWISQDPYFQSLGVRPNKFSGEPQLQRLGSSESAEMLFGCYFIFQPKGRRELGDEKTIILNRIDAALEQAIERQG